MYNQLVFYIEACESGSMFPELAQNIGVAAMTASNATLSSWATYCSPDDVVDGVNIGSCLGDLFSVNWMEDTEANNPATETLLEQYKTVKKLTAESPVELFGELDFGNEYVGDFQGVNEGASPSLTGSFKSLLKKIPRYGDSISNYVSNAEIAINQLNSSKKSVVDSRDVKLHYLFNRVKNASTH